MKQLHHPSREDLVLSTVLYALSDPIRLSVVRDIRQNGEQACNSFTVPIAKSTLSHHLRALREAGIVRTRIQGTQRFISLRAEDLEVRFPGVLSTILDSYEATLSSAE